MGSAVRQHRAALSWAVSLAAAGVFAGCGGPLPTEQSSSSPLSSTATDGTGITPDTLVLVQIVNPQGTPEVIWRPSSELINSDSSPDPIPADPSGPNTKSGKIVTQHRGTASSSERPQLDPNH
jgi:hypothetical protein